MKKRVLAIILIAVTDLNANVSPENYGISVLGIYPEGDVLTDEIMQMIAGAGWKKVEVYYPTFFVSGNPNCGGMTPVVEKTENGQLSQLLASAGYTNQVAVVKVEGVTFSDPIMILYEPDFSFLREGTCIMYKYISDIQRFVAGPTVMYDGYNRGFMDMENLPSADGEVNGTYVVVTQALPVDLVITTADIQLLRDQLRTEDTQIPDNSQDQEQDSDIQDSDIQDYETQVSENTETQENQNEIIITDKDEEIKWTFVSGLAPENFTPEANVEVTSGKDVKVDFAYSGKLPEGTKVMIQLPKEGIEYKEGRKLYFYYYNPETKEYEYVSEGTAESGAVTFDIQHCSEYLITSEKLVKVDVVEKSPDLLAIIAVGFIMLGVAGGVAYFIVKKKNQSLR